MFSNVNIGHLLFFLLELHGDIVLGDIPVIAVDVLVDTETHILEERDAKDVINPFLV